MYDLVVIGGGPGGLSAARAAAKVGAKVALVESAHLGGECTFSACVPSKALIEAARIAARARRAAEYGVRVGTVEVDFAAVMARVRTLVGEFGGSGSGESLRAEGIDVYRGSPRFEAYDTILVDDSTPINGQRFLIATGSRPAVPEIPGLAEVGHLDERSVWSLDQLPASLVVIGGGPAGLELAQAFARLGSKVTVLASSAHILPREDREVSDRVAALLKAEGIVIHTNVEVTEVAQRDGQKVCSYESAAGGGRGKATGTHLLVAAGRLANVEGLDLEVVGIHADAEHGIEVDDYLQTRSSRVFAIGDVLQRHQFTHSAAREAEVAFQNAVLRTSKKIDYSALPWVTFIDPEVATVGLTEDAASEQRPEIRVLRAEYRDLDRARIDGRTEGFAKVVATPSGKILGATVVGEQASLVLEEFVLAMENGLTLGDIASTVHPYPTYSDLALKIAHEFTAGRETGGFMRNALKWFLGLKPRDEQGGEASEPEHEAAHDTHAAGHSNGHGH